MVNNMPENTKGGHPMFHQLLEKMGEIHDKKNYDYGGGEMLGNFMEAKKIGVDPFKAVLVRMTDKYARICSLAKRGTAEVEDESIEDTLIDMANYCLLAIVIRRESTRIII